VPAGERTLEFKGLEFCSAGLFPTCSSTSPPHITYCDITGRTSENGIFWEVHRTKGRGRAVCDLTQYRAASS